MPQIGGPRSPPPSLRRRRVTPSFLPASPYWPYRWTGSPSNVPLGRLAGMRRVAICLLLRRGALQISMLHLVSWSRLPPHLCSSVRVEIIRAPTRSLTHPLSPGGGVSCLGSSPSILVIQGPLKVCLSI